MTIDSPHFAKTIIEKRFQFSSDVSTELKRELEEVMLNPELFNEKQFEKFSLEEIFI
jgi:hypothetical protein